MMHVASIRFCLFTMIYHFVYMHGLNEDEVTFGSG